MIINNAINNNIIHNKYLYKNARSNINTSMVDN